MHFAQGYIRIQAVEFKNVGIQDGSYFKIAAKLRKQILLSNLLKT